MSETMCRNKQLNEKLKKLTQSTLSYLDEEMHIDQEDEKYNSKRIRNSIFIEKYVKKFTEYKECLTIMEQDEKIKTHLEKSVGTSSIKSNINADDCIVKFITKIYLNSIIFDQIIFNEEYQHFEDLFFSGQITFRDTSRIYNFFCDTDVIELDSEIKIKKDKLEISPEDLSYCLQYKPGTVLYQSNYIIERIYGRKKIIGKNTDIDNENRRKEITENSDLFDKVIYSLRVLKSSGVFRTSIIDSETITFNIFNLAIGQIPFYDNFVLGEECKIDTSEIMELQKVFNFIKNEEENRFLVAVRRLSLGMEREKLEDKIIDYMIGLEALYLPDVNDELKFRLSLRISFLLFPKEEREDVFSFVKEMYDQRSKIVHGTKSKNILYHEKINRLEELLRKSIMLWIEDKNNFSKTEKTNSGKLISKGKLDTIFFDM